jgi:hypothetical protein
MEAVMGAYQIPLHLPFSGGLENNAAFANKFKTTVN